MSIDQDVPFTLPNIYGQPDRQGAYMLSFGMTDESVLQAIALLEDVPGMPPLTWPPIPEVSFISTGDPESVVVEFDASATTCIIGDKSEATYTWVFGDGQSTSGVGLTTVTHTYPGGGNYSVLLTVVWAGVVDGRFGAGGIGGFSEILSLMSHNVPPTASFVIIDVNVPPIADFMFDSDVNVPPTASFTVDPDNLPPTADFTVGA